MLSVRGIYENGQVRLTEPMPFAKRARVIVTILEDAEDLLPDDQGADMNLFDELIGAIHLREDGSVLHDHYLANSGERS